MPDVVVTLPLKFGLKKWLDEGDAAVVPPDPPQASDVHYYWGVGRNRPDISPGERVYVVYGRRLIGYSPLVHLQLWPPGVNARYYLVRQGHAVAVTIDEDIDGFRGYRYRWWEREDERPFTEWKEYIR